MARVVKAQQDETKPFQVREAATARLKLRPDLIFTPRESDGHFYYLVEDPLRSKFFRIGAPEYDLVSVFDGRTTIIEAVGLTAARLGSAAFTEREALAISRWLIESQLATTPESAGANRLAAAADKAQLQRHAAAFNPLAIRFRLFNPDRLLDVLLPWTSWLLSWPALAVWFMVLLVGILTAASMRGQLADRSLLLLDPGNWLRLAVAWTALKLLHESFHALACKKFGGNVVRAGVMLLFFAPVAYTDVTSSWRCRSKWQRIVTAAAGMYAELFVAALAVIYWARTPDGLAHQLAFDILLMAGLGTVVFNINPLLRFDGYYILSDLLGIPNLYSQGRQAVIGLLQKYGLGHETIQSGGPAATRRIILAYGVAALIWQGIVYFGLALLVIGTLAYLGAILVGLFAFFAVFLPTWRTSVELVRTGTSDRRGRRRRLRTALIGVGVAVFVAWFLTRPGSVRTPAVIEYAPVTTIRAATPGFVHEICVESGGSVEEGQIIAVLDNPELTAEFVQLKLSASQATLRARMYFAEHELTKYQIELADQKALQKRVNELRGQIAALTIRSPSRGHVVGRQLSSLPGQYLKTGTEIAVIGDENAKELIVALGQDDLESFRAELGAPVSVRIFGVERRQISWDLTQIEPQASLSSPHPALSSRLHGPLAVKMALCQPGPDRSDTIEHDELLRPCFKATIRIPIDDGWQFHAGQKAVVYFASPVETRGTRLARDIGIWIQNQCARVKSPPTTPAS